jgi:hypothetical protein
MNNTPTDSVSPPPTSTGMFAKLNRQIRQLAPHELTRWPYFIGLVVFWFAVFLISVLIPFQAAILYRCFGVPVDVTRAVIIGLLTLPAALFRIYALDLPRMRDAGWPVWLYGLFFIPLINMILQLMLFFAPTKPPPEKEAAEQSRAAVRKVESLRDLGDQSGW